MTGKIITISRQFGSGGRTVGREVAEKLGLKCYDSEIIRQIAEESGFSEDYVKENGEYTEGSGLFNNFGPVDFYGRSNRITIWTEQCRIIRKLAHEGPCVIVGRCADYVLRDEADHLRVFVYSDMESRAKRVVNEYGETDEKIEKRLRDKDKRRAAYYEIYTDQKFGDPQNYDLCLNSGTLGIDECVNMIVNLYQKDNK